MSNKVNVGATIAPKSDQLNADDLIEGVKTIKVRDVKGTTDANQPISIYFEGDNNKPYKPCKSMRRVLVRAWGTEGLDYIGKKMTIYLDEAVVFGGVQVGGIRISHMSELTEPLTIALSESRSKRKPFTIQPLIQKAKVKEDLNPNHEKWQGAVDALKAKTTTIEKIKGAYLLTAENENLLTKLTENENV